LLATLAEKLAVAEEVFFRGPAQGDNLQSENLKSIRWDPEALEKSFLDAGFTVKKEIVDRQEERLISVKDLSLWFDREKSNWGAFIAEALGEKDFSDIRGLLENRIGEGPVQWKWKSILLKAAKNQS
jgi:putative ATPase